MSQTLIRLGFLNAFLFFAGSSALASTITEIEPNNLPPQVLDGHFSLDFSPDIGDFSTNTSTTIPHVTVNGTGDDTFDYYAFTVTTAGSTGIIDIDYGSGFDPFIYLINLDTFAFVDSNNDSLSLFGAGGSTSFTDSYLQLTFATPGVYLLSVGNNLFVTTGPVPTGASYQLQVSLENASSTAVPEPSTMVLVGLGVLELIRRRKRA